MKQSTFLNADIRFRFVFRIALASDFVFYARYHEGAGSIAAHIFLSTVTEYQRFDFDSSYEAPPLVLQRIDVHGPSIQLAVGVALCWLLFLYLLFPYVSLAVLLLFLFRHQDYF